MERDGRGRQGMTGVGSEGLPVGWHSAGWGLHDPGSTVCAHSGLLPGGREAEPAARTPSTPFPRKRETHFLPEAGGQH